MVLSVVFSYNTVLAIHVYASAVNDCKRHHQQSELSHTSDFPGILLG